MLSFEDGFSAIMDLAEAVETKTVPIEKAVGCVLRKSLTTKRAQPPFDNSAMDGYALAGAHLSYDLVGEVAAGAQDFGELKDGQCVRIFTGAPLPKGADRILIQENAIINGSLITSETTPTLNAHIRELGQDFNAGFELQEGTILTPETIALIAAMNFNTVEVSRRLRVAIIATGNELVPPSKACSEHQVIASNAYGIAAMLTKWNVDAEILPIVKDDLNSITQALTNTNDFDIVITTGGASVGDYDFVPQAATNAGFDIKVHKIAMRPGKPVLAGKRENTILLGLPGNPVSAMITGRMFLGGLVQKLSGVVPHPPVQFSATLDCEVEKNGDRAHFMRASIYLKDGIYHANPVRKQDSAMLSLLSQSNGLIIRKPHEIGSSQGDLCKFIWLD